MKYTTKAEVIATNYREAYKQRAGAVFSDRQECTIKYTTKAEVTAIDYRKAYKQRATAPNEPAKLPSCAFTIFTGA